MPVEQRFSVDERRVAHETIDGETILINFQSGTYHSLTGTGPEIWALAIAGWTGREIAAELIARHGGEEAVVEEEVAGLLERLADEQLLDPAEATERTTPVQDGLALNGPFVAPQLQSYADMEYLLMLDPVHDAEAAGWPEQRAGPALGAR
jgi:Coenzyme PQQ synthesis protein D (PqqD)